MKFDIILLMEEILHHCNALRKLNNPPLCNIGSDNAKGLLGQMTKSSTASTCYSPNINKPVRAGVLHAIICYHTIGGVLHPQQSP